MGRVVEMPKTRPAWVRAAITELMELAAEIESHRGILSGVALQMKSGGADTTELADASHDLDHAWRHITAARRVLDMTWPEEPPKH